MFNLLRTLIWLKWRAFRNARWRTARVLSIVLMILACPLYLIAALAVGGGASYLAYEFSESISFPTLANLQYMGMAAVAFFLFIFWVIVPVAGRMKEHDALFDPSCFFLLPVPRGHLHMLATLLGVVDPWSFFLLFPLVGMATGVALRQPQAAPASVLVFAATLFFLLTSAHLLGTFLNVIYGNRGRKELLILLLPLFLGGIFLLPQILMHLGVKELVRSLHGGGGDWDFRILFWYLPPLWPVLGWSAAVERHWVHLACAVTALLGAGIVCCSTDYLLFRRAYTGAGVGSGARLARGPRRERSMLRLPVLSPEVDALYRKEVLYIFRSSLGRYNFLGSAFVFLIGWFVFSEGIGGRFPREVLLPGLVCILESMVLGRFALNYFGWEGWGVTNYFLLPVKGRQVFLAKALAVMTYGIALFAWIVLLSTWTIGPMELKWWLVVLPSLVLLLLVPALGGCFYSCAFPRKASFERVHERKSPGCIAQIAGHFLQSATLLPITAGVLGVVLLRLWWPSGLFLSVVGLLVALLGGVILEAAGRWMHDRREAIIEAVTDDA